MTRRKKEDVKEEEKKREGWNKEEAEILLNWQFYDFK